MASENWNRIKQIFQEALELSPAEREAFLDRACEGDKNVRAEVETLLAAHDGGGDLLQSPTASLPESLPAEGPGTVIGRYKLLQLIGEGGFGSVYMAEQERPVRRKVALKIIKLGMDTKQVIARFEAERQALALMDHPNIARVLDAGATETGRPYFVMELVRGIPITEYCDQNNLTTGERLELFQSVCSAVQHAHQKGIIHRDIKPSNVMVTLHDGVPVPKVIDFGIAKATNQRLTEKTLFTEYHQFVGTPQYMSPEQAEMSGLDVDTRTDIYALGVLLYELLTGTTPFDPNRLRGMAYSEIHRVIREEEPDKPSTRVSTLGEAATDTAKSRATDVGTLRRTLSGDLDWIVMRAIEKDRTRRYDTANSLRLDIERHLRNEPVLASPPSAPYRVRKFVRRNRTAVLVFGAVAATLVVGIAFATFGFVQASRERAVARREAEAATAINDFFSEMLASLNPKGSLLSPTLGGSSESRVRRDISVKEMLLEATDRIETSFEGKPLLEAQARETIAKTLLGLDAGSVALEQFDKALEIRRETLGENHREVLRSQLLVLGALSDQQRLGRAVELGRELTLKLERQLGGDDPLTLLGANLYATAMMHTGRFAAVDSIYRVTLERQRRVLGSNHSDTILTLLSWTMRHCWAGNGPKAIELSSEAYRRAKETYHPDDSLVHMAEGLYAASLTFMHRSAEALAIIRPALEQAEETGEDRWFLQFALSRSLSTDYDAEEKEARKRRSYEDWKAERSLGDFWVGIHDFTQLLVHMGKLDEAARIGGEVHEDLAGRPRGFLTQSRTNFIRNLVRDRYECLLAVAGKRNDLRSLERDRLSELRDRARADSAGLGEWNSYAWELLTCESRDLRDPAEALVWATRAVEADERDDPVGRAFTLDTQARALGMTGDLEGAFDTESRALELSQTADGGSADDAAATLLPEVIRYATLLGRDAEAEELVRRVMDGVTARHGEGSEDASNALRKIGDALASRGFHVLAEPMLRRSVAEARRLGDEKTLLESLNALARARARGGRPQEAEELVDEALSLYRNLYVREPIEWTRGLGRTVEGERSRESLSFKSTLAFRLLEIGRVDEAEELLRQVECLTTVNGYAALKGEVLLAKDDGESALPYVRTSYLRNRLSDEMEESPGSFARREGLYGYCLSLVGRHDEGEAFLLRAYDRAMERCGPESARVEQLATWIAGLYSAWGKQAEAAKWRDRAAEQS